PVEMKMGLVLLINFDTRGPRLLLAAKQPRKIAELYEAIRTLASKRRGPREAGRPQLGRPARMGPL
ncbi:MAG TPA: hypothetical protein VIC32_00970, partial [Terriglobales bacterium]